MCFQSILFQEYNLLGPEVRVTVTERKIKINSIYLSCINEFAFLGVYIIVEVGG